MVIALLIVIFVLIKSNCELKKEIKANQEAFSIISSVISEEELKILRETYKIMI